MNENIDLTKILEGCEGIELYSPIAGNCILDEIQEEKSYPIIVSSTKEENEDSLESFTKEGYFYNDYPKSECILFPSKEQRDWSKFQRPIKEGTPMMCRDKPTHDWILCPYIGLKQGKHFVKHRRNSIDSVEENFNYMIPWKDFKPENIEESLKHNIQK